MCVCAWGGCGWVTLCNRTAIVLKLNLNKKTNKLIDKKIHKKNRELEILKNKPE